MGVVRSGRRQARPKGRVLTCSVCGSNEVQHTITFPVQSNLAFIFSLSLFKKNNSLILKLLSENCNERGEGNGFYTENKETPEVT